MTQFGVRPWLSNPKFAPPPRPVIIIIPPPKPEPEPDPPKPEIVFDALDEVLAMRRIAKEVAIKHGLESWKDLFTRTKRQRIVYARQEAWWRCRRETGHSFPMIGAYFGGYDRSTIVHGVDAHEKRSSTAPCELP